MTSNKINLIIVVIFLCIYSISGQTYQIMDVTCYDKSDNLLENPFVGGLNCPQFNEIDLDLDGVMDLLIFDREGNARVTYLYKDNKYQYAPQYKNIFPSFKKWVRLRDYNKDGVMDIFCYNLESPLDGIEIYTGSIENGSYKFTKIPFDKGFYEIVYYQIPPQTPWYNMEVISSDIPEIIDIDSDGDLDIITFTGDGGYVRYYQNMDVEDGESLERLKYILKDNCWGKFYESGFNDNIKLSDDPDACQEPEFKGDENDTKSPRHAGSTVTCYDDDNDGKYEIIIGDLTNNNLSWLYNTGTSEKAYMSQIDTFFPVYDTKVDMVMFNGGFIQDIDHDGNDDFIAAPNFESGAENINNVWYYRNTATDGQHDFEFVKDDFLSDEMYDFGSMTNPAVCDYNQDGKKDLLIGTYGFFKSGSNPDARLMLLENVSVDDKLAYKLVDENYLNFADLTGSYFSFAPAFADMDGDGDDDLIIGTQTGSMLYLENTAGTGNVYSFAPIEFDYMNIDVGENVKPTIIDLNRDGLLDIILGERTQNAHPDNGSRLGNLNYFQNQGTVSAPFFSEDSKIAPNTNVLGNVVTKDNTTFNGSAAPFFLDTGEDFLLYTGSENGRIKLYNVGHQDSIYGTFNLLDDDITSMHEGGRTTICIDDLNNDGLMEFIVGNVRGGFAIYGSNLTPNGEVGSQETELITLSIFPNPGQSSFTLKSTDYLVGKVLVYNQLGQLIHKEVAEFHEKQISCEAWPAGIYNIQVETTKGHVQVIQFVKSDGE